MPPKTSKKHVKYEYKYIYALKIYGCRWADFYEIHASSIDSSTTYSCVYFYENPINSSVADTRLIMDVIST
jgi:hypothetical protein